MVGRRFDFALQLDKLAGRKTHGVRHRLSMRESRVERRTKEFFALRGRRLDKKAQKIIVLDFKPDVGRLGITRLQGGDDGAALVAQRARFVEFDVAARANEIAVAALERQALFEAARDFGRERSVGCGEAIDVARDFGRRVALKAFRNLPRHGERRPDGGEIARSAALKRKTRERPREIGRAREPRPQRRAQRRPVDKMGDGVEPRADARGIGRGRGETLGQETGSRRRDAEIDDGQKRTLARARQGARQFEIGASRLVDVERRARAKARRARERRTAAFLRALHVEDGDRGRSDLRVAPAPEAVERRHAKEVHDAARAIARFSPEGGDRRAERFQKRVDAVVLAQGLRRDDLPWLQSREKGGEVSLGAFHEREGPGRYIDARDAETPGRVGGANARERREGVRPRRIEQRVLGDRARGDEAHDIASHHRLRPAFSRFCGILDLLTDGDAMAERNELLEIVIGALDRDAAHRNVVAQMFAALGEHDAECAGRDFRVVEEQFVKIAHAVKEQAVRIRRFDLDILRDHRRGARAAWFARAGLIRRSLCHDRTVATRRRGRHSTQGVSTWRGAKKKGPRGDPPWGPLSFPVTARARAK